MSSKNGGADSKDKSTQKVTISPFPGKWKRTRLKELKTWYTSESTSQGWAGEALHSFPLVVDFKRVKVPEHVRLAIGNKRANKIESIKIDWGLVPETYEKEGSIGLKTPKTKTTPKGSDGQSEEEENKISKTPSRGKHHEDFHKPSSDDDGDSSDEGDLLLPIPDELKVEARACGVGNVFAKLDGKPDYRRYSIKIRMAIFNEIQRACEGTLDEHIFKGKSKVPFGDTAGAIVALTRSCNLNTLTEQAALRVNFWGELSRSEKGENFFSYYQRVDSQLEKCLEFDVEIDPKLVRNEVLNRAALVPILREKARKMISNETPVDLEECVSKLRSIDTEYSQRQARFGRKATPQNNEEPVLSAGVDNKKQRECRFFKRGISSKAASCPFKHGKKDPRPSTNEGKTNKSTSGSNEKGGMICFRFRDA